MKFSIIVPVYNVEKYLEKCLNSLLTQSYKNFEVIVVNDGSPDNSEKIINEFVKKDKRVRYFKKENGGLSNARNYGVTKAKGDYLVFVDSDDFIDENLLEVINDNIIDNLDIIRFQVRTINDAAEEDAHEQPFENLNNVDAFEIISKYKYIEPAWCYAYNASFWKKNKFEYANGKYHEDFGLTPLILFKARKISSVDYIGYNYIIRDNSIMTTTNYTKTKQKVFDMLDHFDYLYKEINKITGLTVPDKSTVFSYIANSLIIKGRELDKKDLEEYRKELVRRKIFELIKTDTLVRKVKRLIIKINYRMYINRIK